MNKNYQAEFAPVHLEYEDDRSIRIVEQDGTELAHIAAGTFGKWWRENDRPQWTWLPRI